MFKSIPALVFSAIVFGVLAPPIPAIAVSGTDVNDQTSLQTALAACDGTPATGAAYLSNVINVDADLTLPSACTDGFTLDLNGQAINGKSFIIAAGAKLTITDTSAFADGELNMTATESLLAGIHVADDSTLIINKGTVNASGKLTSGGYGAGIGTAASVNGGEVIITGGTVTATGGFQAAGIGGGQHRGDTKITISGGTVTATGGQYAAGIGGGDMAAGQDITISGGTVTAIGGEDGAGIGGGYDSDAQSKISITGGTVTAQAGEDAAGIGGGAYDAGGTISISGGTVNATGSVGGAGIGTGLAAAGGEEQNITISAGTVVANGGELGGAGIGGGRETSGKNITITGGTVTATGGGITDGGGAGIGGGYGDEESPDGGNISIEGGTINAQGGYRSAGIGGGRNGDGGFIVVIAGTVTATGSNDAAGIGGGRSGDGGTIYLGEDAEVTAVGGNNGAGIGGGRYGNGGSISIDSENVTATGGSAAAGIGGGDGGEGAQLTIDSDAIVTATGGETAIGAGFGGSATFGYLELGGELRVPSGSFKIHDSNESGVEVTIEETGKLLGDVVGGNPTLGATIYGAGQIQNDGIIALTAQSFDDAFTILGNFFIVDFDVNGGEWVSGDTQIYVFAPNFDSSYRALPTNPTKNGFTFNGWSAEVSEISDVSAAISNVGPANGSGPWALAGGTSLRDKAGPNESASPGDGVDIQAVAQWSDSGVPAATIFFKGNSTKLTKAGKAKIKKMVQAAGGAKIAEVSVKGSVNTKRKYWPIYNKWLANKRAKNVAAYVKSFPNAKKAKVKVLSPSKSSSGAKARKVVAKIKVAAPPE